MWEWDMGLEYFLIAMPFSAVWVSSVWNLNYTFNPWMDTQIVLKDLHKTESICMMKISKWIAGSGRSTIVGKFIAFLDKRVSPQKAPMQQSQKIQMILLPGAFLLLTAKLADQGRRLAARAPMLSGTQKIVSHQTAMSSVKHRSAHLIP